MSWFVTRFKLAKDEIKLVNSRWYIEMQKIAKPMAAMVVAISSIPITAILICHSGIYKKIDFYNSF